MSPVDSTNPHQFSYDPVADVAYRTLDFLGYVGYRVGDDGSFWTNLVRGGRAGKGCFSIGAWAQLKPMRKYSPTGRFIRLDVCVGRRSQGGQKGYSAHTLVLLTFVGPCPPGFECCHSPDHDPANNSLVNLRWDTRKANMRDRDLHGRTAHGERGGNAKHSNKLVRQMKAYATNINPLQKRIRAVSERFDVPASTVGKILRGKIRVHG